MKLRNFEIDNNKPMVLMGGMNVLESRDLAMEVAERFKEVSLKHNIVRIKINTVRIIKKQSLHETSNVA